MPVADKNKVKVHRYFSRGRNEKLIRQPTVEIVTALGAKMKQQETVAYDFAPDGMLEVFEGQDPLFDGPLVFDEDTGAMKPSQQDAVQWLASHPVRDERFHEEGREPGRLLPTEDDFLALVNLSTAQLALEPIVVALAQELETHARPLLVRAAEGALEAIETIKAGLEQAEGDALPPAA